ncbi:hypothetical protein EDB83DRAFT_2382340 [Lactarius deliciosus]|nr:hypothetical protein EDB83DRAFT_2382340 [Lactarius deliciosus]
MHKARLLFVPYVAPSSYRIDRASTTTATRTRDRPLGTQRQAARPRAFVNQHLGFAASPILSSHRPNFRRSPRTPFILQLTLATLKTPSEVARIVALTDGFGRRICSVVRHRVSIPFVIVCPVFASFYFIRCRLTRVRTRHCLWWHMCHYPFIVSMLVLFSSVSPTPTPPYTLDIDSELCT